MSNIYFDEEQDKRIELNRLMCNSHRQEGDHFFTEGDFRHYIFTLGLLDFEFRFLPKQTGKPYIPYPMRERGNNAQKQQRRK